MTRIAVLMLALLPALAAPPRASADAPPASHTPEVQLTETEAVRIASQEATRRKIDLADFDPPSVTYLSDGRIGKWHLFYIAKHRVDTCFSVDVYRRGERPHFAWCS